MKNAFLLLTALCFIGCSEESTETENSLVETPVTLMDYPETKTIDTITDYHGTEINDHYQWLENESADDVKQWVTDQNTVTQNYLGQMSQRAAIKDRLTEIWSYAKETAPFQKGDYFFQYKNNGSQDQDVLYYRQGENGEEKVFIDPNALSDKGIMSLRGTYFSEDAKYCVVALSAAGSDWQEMQIRDVATGENIDAPIEWIKFSGASWFGNGFFYSQYEAPIEGQEFSQKNLRQRMYYHIVGSQEEDILVLEDSEHPEWSHGAQVFEEDNTAIIYAYASTSGNALYYYDMILGGPDQQMPSFKPIITNFESDWNVIGIHNEKLLIRTNNQAPRYRLIAIDPDNPEEANWEVVIPQGDNLLQSVQLINDQLVVKYLENVQTSLFRYSLEGEKLAPIEVPGIGIAGGISARKEDNFFYYSFVNYSHPTYIYRYDFESDKSEPFFIPEIAFDGSDLETKQVWYTSKDGTSIPMFITHKVGIELDGTNPTFLFGYGGFNVSYLPEFRIDRTVFLENGGVYAVPNLRGGGEFGQDWHKAGTKERKQNVFNDFIAAAEYLIAEGYTNSDKLAVHGRSNGGLLVGAVMTQRPDLFKVALPKVGVLDMLKFHQFTIGKYWVSDYGCSENEEDFRYLNAYSPIHNVKAETTYPATLVITGDHDDRVVPAHSYKFIAELQAKQLGDNPVLIRIDTDGGHGSGKPISMQIEEFTDTWSFVFHHLGMTVQN